jgi:uncharacterized membrane protein
MNVRIHDCRRPRRERGFALFLALLVLLVVTISGIALLFNTQVEQALSSTETKISKSFYGADSGIEYAGMKLQTDINFVGGAVPGGLSTNYPGSSGNEIQVNVSNPNLITYSIHPKDEIASVSTSYNPAQIAELIYTVASTSTSNKLQATKTINAELGVYPQLIPGGPPKGAPPGP